MSHIQTQRGGALLIAMVMVFMISILGISVMRSSTLEHRLAVNAIRSAVTFQAAESASNFAINNQQNMTLAQQSGLNGRIVLAAFQINPAMPNLETNSSLSFSGESELPEGFSAGVFESLAFVATGVSSMTNSGAQSTVEQGVYRIVPGNGS